MKKIVNTAPMAVITTMHTPYSLLLTTKVVGSGTLTQHQDLVKGMWSPDRTISPLVIEPVFSAFDRDAGQEVVVTPAYTWYANGVQVPASATASDDYYIVGSGAALKAGSLVVRKNVGYDTPVTIRCVASFQEYSAETALLLTSENKPDVFYQVDLMTPNTVEFHPLTDDTSRKTFKAFVQYGDHVLGSSEPMAYFWYIDDVAVTDATVGYVSGLGTDTLVLDADFFDGVTVSVRLGAPYYPSAESTVPVLPEEPNINARAQSGIVWAWDNVSVLPVAIGGNHITQFSTDKHFDSVAKVNGKDLTDAKRTAYLKTRWFTHATDATQGVKTYYGYGKTVTIPASGLQRTGGTNVEVGTDIYLLGHYHLSNDGSSYDRDEVLIGNPTTPAVITTKRAVLSTLLTIKEGENGTLTQYQDLTKNMWSPNRSITPLVLTPVFSAVNDAGEPESVTPEYAWYVDGVRVTTTQADADYYLEVSGGSVTGRLVVRKNVGYDTPVTVKCVATYTDNLHIETYTIDKSVLLTTENKPDTLYTVTLDTTNTLTYHPLTDDSSVFTIHASVQFGNRALLPSEQIAYFWYIDGELTTDEFPDMVSGSGTDTLTVDADFFDGVTVSVRLGVPYYPTPESVTPVLPTAPNINVTASCGIVWDYEGVTVIPVGNGGNAVRDNSGSKRFDAIAQVHGRNVSQDRIDKYLRIQWFKHSANDPQNVRTMYGWGSSITLPASELRDTGDVNVEIGADLYVYEPYRVVVDDATGLVVVDDETGAVIVSND